MAYDEDTLVPGADAPDALEDDAHDAMNAMQAWQDATRPDKPRIRTPEDGVVDLLWGIEVDGVRHRTAMVRELVGRDEETLARLDQERSDYFGLLIDLVVRRGVEQLGPVTVAHNRAVFDDLLVGDRNLLFFNIMLATYGETREYEDVVCPVCRAHSDIEVDLRQVIEIKPLEGDENEFEFKGSKTGIVIARWPNMADMAAVLGAKEASVSERNSLTLQRVVRTINGRVPERGFTETMNLGDRSKLIAKLFNDQPGPSFKEVKLPCSNCDEAPPITFGWADLLQV